MKHILYENGIGVAEVITEDEKKQFLIPTEDQEGMQKVNYERFEQFVKSLAHLFIMMGKADEYKEFWKNV